VYVISCNGPEREVEKKKETCHFMPFSLLVSPQDLFASKSPELNCRRTAFESIPMEKGIERQKRKKDTQTEEESK
jgi:hypothetical protein